MSDVTREGSRLIATWLAASESLERARSSVNRASCDLANAEAALAKWLMPDDMKPGEKIAVWEGDSLFQVELAPRESFSHPDGERHVSHEPKVTVRTRGKHFSSLRAAS